MRVLIAEDEKKIAAFVRKGLTAEGFNVLVCHRGDDALHLASTEAVDAVVLDIMLPGLDGLAVLGRLRAAKNPVPVIFLTARDTLQERIGGLNEGADDYLTKPFSIDELVARLRAVSRRTAGGQALLLQVGDLSLNPTTREARRGGSAIELSSREFSLLEYLMRSPGRVHTRMQLCEQVWDYHFDPGTNVVDVAMQRLRKKIDYGHPAPLLHTVRGAGYTLRSDA